jgi:phage tail P2-like protein
VTERTIAPSDILDDTASGLDRAMVDVAGGALMDAPVHGISDVWDAETIPAEMLPILAYGMGVNLFEDSWSEATKRAWIRDNWHFLALRGTLAGIRMALAPSGYTIQEAVRPPQGFYASPAMTKAELDAWIQRMPSIRITYADRTGLDNGQWFIGESYLEDRDGHVGLDMGWQLWGRYGVLRRNGVDTPLQSLTEETSLEERTAASFERLSIPGQSTMGFFVDDGAADGHQFVDAGEVFAQLVSLRIDSGYHHEVSTVSLNTVTPGLEPIDVRQVITSDIGDAGPYIFADDVVVSMNYVGPELAPRMLADTVYLLDPAVAVVMSTGASFADVDRVGIGLRTAELMVDLHTVAHPRASFVTDTYVGGCYVFPVETDDQDRAIRAIEASRGLLDRVLVRFDPLRPLAVGDRITETSLLGDWVKNQL